MTPTHQDAIRATAWRQSLRQHCDVATLNRSTTGTPHWLLKKVCGRKLLVQKLRQLRPGLAFPIWTPSRVMDPLLEAMVDELGLRTMPEPRALQEQIRFLHWVATQLISTHPCLSLGGSSLITGVRG
jgi:hypothetical protein